MKDTPQLRLRTTILGFGKYSIRVSTSIRYIIIKLVFRLNERNE